MCLKKSYRHLLTAALLMAAIVIFSGCSPVGPDYSKPDIATSGNWNSTLSRGLSNAEDPNLLSQWWSTFNDPMLTSLINRAVEGNLDLKRAQSRVRQARANWGIAKAGLFPTLGFSGSDTWTRASADGGTGQTTQLYSAGFDAGWELDIFGGTRRSIEAANASYQASQEDLYDTLVTLTAEVALNYVEARTYQDRIAKVQENLDAQAQTYQLVVWQNQADLSDDLAVQQALYNLESTRSQMPSLKTGLIQAMNRIAILLGQQPGEISNKLSKTKSIPLVPSRVAVGVPADLMRRRPDIRKAERQLAAQTANIGVAVADLYPKFSLAGSINARGASINRVSSNLLSVNDGTLSYGPGVSWSLFDGGKIRQNIKVQQELQQQTLMSYQSTVLSAAEEVENALTAYVNEQDRIGNLEKAVTAARSAVELSQQKYQAGLIDFSSVLDAQRSLLSFENDLADSSGTVVSNLIRLYKALGGGWAYFVSEKNGNSIVGVNNEERK